MLFLRDEEVRQVLTMAMCLDALEVAFRDLARGEAANRPRSDVEVALGNGTDYRLKSMDGVVRSLGVAAMRVSTDVVRYEGGRLRELAPGSGGIRWQGLVLLFDIHTGEPLAMMPDAYLSPMRVGATSGLGARYLARTGATVLGLYGSSSQAVGLLMGLSAVRKITKVCVYSPTRRSREEFARKAEGRFGCEVIPVEKPRDAAAGADIIGLATNSLRPVVDADWLEPGMHVTTVFWPDLDSRCCERGDIVVANVRPRPDRGDVDVYRLPSEQDAAGCEGGPSRAQARGAAGAELDWQSMFTLGEVLVGKTAARNSDDQITVHVNNVGLGMQFAATALRVYEEARRRGVGQELPRDLFVEHA